MLQVTLIGNLGANAEVLKTDGSQFIKFRVAHTERWTDENQRKQTRTTWVDCTMNVINGQLPAILPYLLAGQTVYVRGALSLRVYSSKVDRCMKAGATIHVRDIELLGGKSDPIPRQLMETDGSVVYDVAKYYNVQGRWPKGGKQLVDKHGTLYNVDKNGWVGIAQENNDPSNVTDDDNTNS